MQTLGAVGINVTEDDIFSPAPVCVQYLQERNLRPFLLVHPSCRRDYSKLDCSQPNAVVLGDAAEEFTYENLNKAFSILIKADNPVLVSLGMGWVNDFHPHPHRHPPPPYPPPPTFALSSTCSRYYEEGGELHLDVGPYAKALEFATSREAVVIGKPSSEFFEGALKKLNVLAEEVHWWDILHCLQQGYESTVQSTACYFIRWLVLHNFICLCAAIGNECVFDTHTLITYGCT